MKPKAHKGEGDMYVIPPPQAFFNFGALEKEN